MAEKCADVFVCVTVFGFASFYNFYWILEMFRQYANYFHFRLVYAMPLFSKEHPQELCCAWEHLRIEEDYLVSQLKGQYFSKVVFAASPESSRY